jgi:hypothetical protein
MPLNIYQLRYKLYLKQIDKTRKIVQIVLYASKPTEVLSVFISFSRMHKARPKSAKNDIMNSSVCNLIKYKFAILTS